MQRQTKKDEGHKTVQVNVEVWGKHDVTNNFAEKKGQQNGSQSKQKRRTWEITLDIQKSKNSVGQKKKKRFRNDGEKSFSLHRKPRVRSSDRRWVQNCGRRWVLNIEILC